MLLVSGIVVVSAVVVVAVVGVVVDSVDESPATVRRNVFDHCFITPARQWCVNRKCYKISWWPNLKCHASVENS